MKWAVKYPKPNSVGAYFIFFRICWPFCCQSIDCQKTTGNFCRFHSSFVFRLDTLSNGENWCAFASFVLLRVRLLFFPLNEYSQNACFHKFRNKTSRPNRQNRTSWASSNSLVIFRMSSVGRSMCEGESVCICVCVCVQKASNFLNDHCPPFYNLENYEQTKSVRMSVASAAQPEHENY